MKLNDLKTFIYMIFINVLQYRKSVTKQVQVCSNRKQMFHRLYSILFKMKESYSDVFSSSRSFTIVFLGLFSGAISVRLKLLQSS